MKVNLDFIKTTQNNVKRQNKNLENELNIKSTLDITKIDELIKSTKHHIRFAKSPSGIDARKLLISNHRASISNASSLSHDNLIIEPVEIHKRNKNFIINPIMHTSYSTTMIISGTEVGTVKQELHGSHLPKQEY